MAAIGLTSLRGIVHDEFQYPFLLASGITQADEGKAVTLDSSAANTVKLAGNGDRILGILMVAEVRAIEGISIGTIALKGGYKFVVNPDATASSPDETPALGDYLVGGTDSSSPAIKGYVQKAQSSDPQDWLVVEVLDSGAAVVAIRV